MKISNFLIVAALLAPTAFGAAVPPCRTGNCPKPKVDDERITAEGKRIRDFGQSDVEVFADKAEFQGQRPKGASSQGPATADETNEQSKEKAEKEKAKSDQAFWASLVRSLVSTWKKSIAGFMGGEVIWTGATEYYESGKMKSRGSCLDIAINTENQNACQKLEIRKIPSGEFEISIFKLIAVKKGSRTVLAYSTNDTLMFVVNDYAEFAAILNSIDPQLDLAI